MCICGKNSKAIDNDIQNTLPDQEVEELKQKYKYDVYGKFRCPTMKHDHHTHEIKRTLDIFYEFVRESIQSNHVKIDTVNNDNKIVFKYKKLISEQLCTLQYAQGNLNELSNLYARNVTNIFDKLLPNSTNMKVSVIYNMIDAATLLPIIIPKCIAVTSHDHSSTYEYCRYDNMLCFEIKYNTQVPNLYIYDYYRSMDTKKWYGIPKLICEKCYDLISHLNNRHCCNCKIEYMCRNNHCCTCKTEYNPNTQLHCCQCVMIYGTNQSHCCTCKINVDGRHCDVCHMSCQNKYHCCTCKTVYNKFNEGCKICDGVTTCSICDKENIVPAENFRTACNKNLICVECSIAIQSSQSPSCPFCRNTDIKAHILFE